MNVLAWLAPKRRRGVDLDPAAVARAVALSPGPAVTLRATARDDHRRLKGELVGVMPPAVQEAIDEVSAAREALASSTPEYVEAATQLLDAAQERLNALFREAKRRAV